MLEPVIVALAVGLAGDAVALSLGLDRTGEAVVLGDLRRGLIDGCFVLNDGTAWFFSWSADSLTFWSRTHVVTIFNSKTAVVDILGSSLRMTGCSVRFQLSTQSCVVCVFWRFHGFH